MTDETPPPQERGFGADSRPEPEASDADPAPFEALANRRRRYVLRSLIDAPDGVAHIEELADYVQRRECDAEESVPADHRDRVVASLYHVDVPRLADAGLLEFDVRSKTVRYRENEPLETVLELVSTVDTE